MKNVLQPLAKNVLILGLTANEGIIIILNEEMGDVMRKVNSLEDTELLLKGVTKTIDNETREQKADFFIFCQVRCGLIYQKIDNLAKCFDNFSVEHILKEIKIFIGKKNVITNISRIQAYDLTRCGYSSIVFINLMFPGKTLKAFTNIFISYNFEQNDKVVLNYFLK